MCLYGALINRAEITSQRRTIDKYAFHFCRADENFGSFFLHGTSRGEHTRARFVFLCVRETHRVCTRYIYNINREKVYAAYVFCFSALMLSFLFFFPYIYTRAQSAISSEAAISISFFSLKSFKWKIEWYKKCTCNTVLLC